MRKYGLIGVPLGITRIAVSPNGVTTLLGMNDDFVYGDGSNEPLPRGSKYVRLVT